MSELALEENFKNLTTTDKVEDSDKELHNGFDKIENNNLSDLHADSKNYRFANNKNNYYRSYQNGDQSNFRRGAMRSNYRNNNGPGNGGRNYNYYGNRNGGIPMQQQQPAQQFPGLPYGALYDRGFSQPTAFPPNPNYPPHHMSPHNLPPQQAFMNANSNPAHMPNANMITPPPFPYAAEQFTYSHYVPGHNNNFRGKNNSPNTASGNKFIAPLYSSNEDQSYFPAYQMTNNNCFRSNAPRNHDDNYNNKSYGNNYNSYRRRETSNYKEGTSNNAHFQGGGDRNQDSKLADYEQNTAAHLSSGSVHEHIWSQHLDRNPEVESQLFTVSLTGINFSKYDDIPVQTTGENCPDPISSFEEFDCGEILKQNIKLCGYSTPTPIQKHAIPIIKMKRDLMACAQTGSGKTAAFLLPILSNMFRDGPPQLPYYQVKNFRMRCTQTPNVLVLAPTRELAIQIHLEALKLSYTSKIKLSVIYGGSDMLAQMNSLRFGCDVVVATPGRLLAMLKKKKLSLAAVRYLVLDEADRMLDMGFEPQIREIIEDSDLPPIMDQDGRMLRQTLMFSATFPKEIQILAQDFLSSYLFLCVGQLGSISENITQEIVWVDEQEKRVYLLKVLDSFFKESADTLVLVFVQTKKSAHNLMNYLCSQNLPATAIHGSRQQFEREEALHKFKSRQLPILVATSVAARGLDIPNVQNVINYDLPSNIDEYIHRIGRTGRVGNLGLALSFYNESNDNILKDLTSLFVQSNLTIPKCLQSRSNSIGSGAKSDASRYRSYNYRSAPQRNFSSYDHRYENQGNKMRGNNTYRGNNYTDRFGSESINHFYDQRGYNNHEQSYTPSYGNAYQSGANKDKRVFPHKFGGNKDANEDKNSQNDWWGSDE